MATAFAISVAALAQTGSAAAAPGAASSPIPSAPSASTPVATGATGTKVGTIAITEAIFGSNEGQRDLETLGKKLEPKQNELKGMSDEIEGLKKQLNTQGDKLNDDARATLVKQIEQKQKAFERNRQDAQEEFQGQQQEIASRILQKMGPMVVKYANDNAFGLIIDTSNQWPQGPVLWYGPSVDITKAIVEAYNVQSGVPAPAPKPAGTGAKPAGAAKPGIPPAKAPAQQTPPPKQ
jgi:outer membrane protein